MYPVQVVEATMPRRKTYPPIPQENQTLSLKWATATWPLPSAMKWCPVVATGLIFANAHKSKRQKLIRLPYTLWLLQKRAWLVALILWLIWSGFSVACAVGITGCTKNDFDKQKHIELFCVAGAWLVVAVAFLAALMLTVFIFGFNRTR